jgi:hypothetical protein
LQADLIREGQIETLQEHRLYILRHVNLTARRQEHESFDAMWLKRGESPRDPVAEGMTDDEGLVET